MPSDPLIARLLGIKHQGQQCQLFSHILQLILMHLHWPAKIWCHKLPHQGFNTNQQACHHVMSFRNFNNFSQEIWKDVLEVGVPKKQATAAHYFDDYWWHIQNTDWLLGGVEVQKVMGIDHITFCHFFCGTSAKKKDESWLQHAAMKRGGHRPAAPTLTMDSYGFSFAQLHHMSVGFWKKSANERWCTVLNKKLIRDLKYLM